MYKCDVCKAVSQPGQLLLKHVVYREVPVYLFDPEKTRQEIEKEIPVCPSCAKALKGGTSLQALMRQAQLRPSPAPISEKKNGRTPPSPVKERTSSADSEWLSKAIKLSDLKPHITH